MSQVPVDAAAGDGKLWFGHPRPLARLFMTEAFERFGFYGMRVILALYLTKHFLFNDHTANGLYGAVTSLVYLTPMIGGLLADRYLGSKRSVKLGAIMMAVGYFGLCWGGEMAKPKMTLFKSAAASASESTVYDVEIDNIEYEISGNDQNSLVLTPTKDATAKPRTIANGLYRFNGQRDPFWVNMMFLSLSCVIVGNGFFKPNISTMVGSLYAEGDTRRDAGFTIFYMGINLGSMLSQGLCPMLADSYGWWAGFMLAAFGMLTAWALIQFEGGRLRGYGEPPPGIPRSSVALIHVGAILAVPVMWYLLHNTMISSELANAAVREGKGIIHYLRTLPLLGQVLFALFFVATIGIPIWSFRKGTRQEAEKMLAAIIMIVFSVVFWTLFEQAGSSLTLFADRNTDRNISGFGLTYEMPAGQVQIFNALFIVMFAPLMSWLWVWLARRRLEPSIPLKFAIALMLVGLGFLVLVFGARYMDTGFRVGLSWLVLAYLIHSIGELCLSPVGLSMITKLSMARVVGLMMGVWFLSSSVAQYVGGVVAQLASVETVAGEVTNPEVALKTYLGVFQMIGLWSIGFGVALLVLTPWLKRMMHGVR
jgi:POT family proton-dependent oligopeptide transporter